MTASIYSSSASPSQAHAVVYWWPLIEGLVAISHFTSVVQPNVRVEIRPDDEELVLTAMAPRLIARVCVPLQHAEIFEEAGSSFELPPSQVADLKQRLKTKRRENVDVDDQPILGIVVTDEALSWFDETGLGLSLPMIAHRRAQADVPMGLATVVDNAFDIPQTQDLFLEQWQMKKLTAAAKGLGGHARFRPLEVTNDFQASKALITAGPLAALAVVGLKDVGLEEPEPEAAHDHRDNYLNLAIEAPSEVIDGDVVDAEVVDEVEDVAVDGQQVEPEDERSTPRLSIVRANPPEGFA